MVWLTEAQPPAGMRLYAIGDVHGCLDALTEVHDTVVADLDARPTENWRLIHIGDYVDRGPDSRRVIEFLRLCVTREPRVICLMGNHDQMFIEALADNPRWRDVWLENGGATTLASYGLRREDFELRLFHGRSFDDAVPPEHIDFLRGLPFSVRFGDYFFAHAGIDPDVALDRQDQQTLLWIRHRFLRDGREHPAVIVHGHTPAPRIDVRPNRLGIDTGAVFDQSPLTCVMLEGTTRARLTPGGLAPLV